MSPNEQDKAEFEQFKAFQKELKRISINQQRFVIAEKKQNPFKKVRDGLTLCLN